MNIKLTYLYRNGANYKQYHSIVFPNPAAISAKEIQTTITNHLIDQSWFIAKEWNLPDLHFKEYPWDNEIDHECHEFASVEETECKRNNGNAYRRTFSNGLQ